MKTAGFNARSQGGEDSASRDREEAEKWYLFV
jgi:hypothetical protein